MHQSAQRKNTQYTQDISFSFWFFFSFRNFYIYGHVESDNRSPIHCSRSVRDGNRRQKDAACVHFFFLLAEEVPTVCRLVNAK